MKHQKNLSLIPQRDYFATRINILLSENFPRRPDPKPKRIYAFTVNLRPYL